MVVRFQHLLRVFTVPDGRSAFGLVKVPMSSRGEIGLLSDLARGQGVIFRETPGDYYFDSHNAPREQIIINLDADVDVTTTRDGKRRLARGTAFFVEGDPNPIPNTNPSTKLTLTPIPISALTLTLAPIPSLTLN